MDNSVGTFLPADPSTFGLSGRAYDLREIFFGHSEDSSKSSRYSNVQASPSHLHSQQLEKTAVVNSGRCFEAVASFRLIWWNRGSSCKKKISIWRPIIPEGMVYFGDIAVKG